MEIRRRIDGESTKMCPLGKNIKTYIVSVVQEKAFDKVDREFLYNIMEKLGYSKTFINFI